MEELNGQLRDLAVRLDWSEVEGVAMDVLTQLLYGLELDLHADQLGLKSVPPTVEPQLLGAFGLAEAPAEPTDDAHAPAVRTVSQKDGSAYGDVAWDQYEYPGSIPNGRRVRAGDHLVCILPSNRVAAGRSGSAGLDVSHR